MHRQRTPHPTQPKQIHGPKPLTLRVLLTLSDKPFSDTNTQNRLVLRVCQWSSQPSPVLEVRHQYIKQDGTRRDYEVRSICADDIEVIAQHWTEIVEALRS